MVATIERIEENTTATIVICFFEFITSKKLPYDIKVIFLFGESSHQKSTVEGPVGLGPYEYAGSFAS